MAERFNLFKRSTPAPNTQISAEDVQQIRAFVATLKQPAEYREGKLIKRVPAAIYRQLWGAR